MMQRDPSSVVLFMRDVFAACVIAAVIFLIGLGTAVAQGAPPKSSNAAAATTTSGAATDPRMAELSKSLKLTTQQASALQTAMASEREAMQALRETMRKKSDAIHDETRAKLAKVLNAEQMGRYEEWREANRPQRPPEGGPPPGGPQRDGREGEGPNMKRRPQ